MNTKKCNDVTLEANLWSKDEQICLPKEMRLYNTEKDSNEKSLSGKQEKFSFEKHLDKNSSKVNDKTTIENAKKAKSFGEKSTFSCESDQNNIISDKTKDDGTDIAIDNIIGDSIEIDLSSLETNETNDFAQTFLFDKNFDESELLENDSDETLSLPIFEHSGSELTQKYSTHINADININSENTHTPISVVPDNYCDLRTKESNFGTTDIFSNTSNEPINENTAIMQNFESNQSAESNYSYNSTNDIVSTNDDTLENFSTEANEDLKNSDNSSFLKKPIGQKQAFEQNNESTKSASFYKTAGTNAFYEKIEKNANLDSFAEHNGTKFAKYNFNTRIEDIKKMNYSDDGKNMSKDNARDFSESRNSSFAERTHAFSKTPSFSENKLNSILQTYESVHVKHSSASHQPNEGTTTSYVDTVRGAIPAIINQIDELKKYRNKSLPLKIDLSDGQTIECRMSILDNTLSIQFDEMDTDLMSSLKDGWHWLSSEAAKRHINLKKPAFKGVMTTSNNATSAIHFVA